jgi:oligopeptide transport system substrate-binding protein
LPIRRIIAPNRANRGALLFIYFSMKRIFIGALALSFLLNSCSNENGSDELPVAKGDRVYGNYLRVSENDTYQTLYPVAITDATSGFVATQIYEGLVKFNPANLRIVNALAEKIDVDQSGTKYTFTLRKGVFFQDDECYAGGKGREVKAADFKFSYELLCSASEDNQNFSTTFKDRVAGANEFFEASKKGQKTDLAGVKATGEYTLEITLVRPSSVFLQILAEPVCAVVSKEAVERYGKNLKTGCGPFMLDNATSTPEKIVLKRNKNYYGVDTLGNKLPFLDSVVISIVPSKEKELALFREGKLDMILSLPSESVKEMVETQISDFQSKPPKYLLDNSPEMITQYYTFNLTHKPFDNIKVRKAFNMAIDRQKIIDDVLNGQAYGPGVKGLTPPTFLQDGYDISKIMGYDFNPSEAKKLLAEAGFKDGKGFPPVKIELNLGGGKNTNVVVEIQKQLMENLGVNVDFEVVPYSQKLEDAKMGRPDIIRDAWIADYPSPETFLGLFVGENVPADPNAPSFPNTARYKNPEYDRHFAAGRDARHKDSAMVNFMRAEQILMNDAPIMVLWYEGNYRLTQWAVKNCFTNGMRYRNFTEVYIKAARPAEAKENEKKDETK